LSVYCACGAQWHGEWVLKAADTIAVHEARGQAAQTTGAISGCRPVTHDEYQRLYPVCYCAACEAARREAWTAKRQAAAARRGR
jgi:hypothetical protein